MTLESPIRAQADSRILDQHQGTLFDEQADSSAQLLADYRQRYGLAEDPFADDYSFPLFSGASRRQLLDRLLHLCQFSSSLLVVLGDDGVGKTRIAHGFMDSLSEQDNLSYLPLKAGQTTQELLAAVVEDLELQAGGSSETALLACLEQLMAGPQDEDGLAVVVIDNAHLLASDTLQTLVDLLQRHPEQSALHLVLFGEPALMDRLERCQQESLLLNDFYLQPFTLAETVDYLNFRMEMADYLGPEIFSEAMVSPWWRQSQGQLRVIHQQAQERLLESVVAPRASPLMNGRNLPVLHIVAISALIALVAVVFLYMDQEVDSPAPSAPLALPVPTPAPASAPAARDLTRTDTPVQPLMQSLHATEPAAAPTTAIAPTATAITTPPAATPTAATPTVTATPATAPVPAVVTAPSTPAVAAPAPAPAPVQAARAVPAVPAKPAQPAAKASVSASAAASTQEQTLLGWPAGNYTIQLLGVSNEKAARDYMAAQPNKTDLLMFKSRRQGRDWFVVVTGRYASSALARQAIASLPVAQREAGPWPREVGAIQQEIRSR